MGIKLSQLQSLRWGLHGPTQWNVPSGAFTSRKPMVCCEQKVNSSKSTSPDINSGSGNYVLRPRLWAEDGSQELCNYSSNVSIFRARHSLKVTGNFQLSNLLFLSSCSRLAVEGGTDCRRSERKYTEQSKSRNPGNPVSASFFARSLLWPHSPK